MDRQAACDKYEAEMRKHHPTFQHTAERQEIQESGRKIPGRINRINLDIKEIKAQLEKVGEELDPKISPPNGGVLAGRRWVTVHDADVIVADR